MAIAARWIVVVFHADSHPRWENRTTAAPNRVLARPSRKVRGEVEACQVIHNVFAHAG
jgi:hypothetical protein